MHKVSRTLLLAGVLAFGTLTAACGDKVELTQVQPFIGVQSVTVSPPNATINVGTSIQLSGSVLADASTAKTLTWTSSNAAVATVDQTGRVTGVSAGTVTILATSTADATKSGAAAILVQAVAPTQPPQISINSVTQNGIPVNLSNTAGQVDVTLNIANTSGGAGSVEVFLSTNCTTNTIGATDALVATQAVQAGQAGPVTLSFNTAQLTAANAPRFANASYCIKTRLTSGTQNVVATLSTPITLNNGNVFRGSLAFTSANGGNVTSAVSTLNGLQYNQGNLTATVTPAIFTSASPVALISGYLTRNGEQANGGVGAAGAAVFNNIGPTTAGGNTFAITFTDTGSVAGVRSIFQYTSLPAGDTLYITAATDAAGNQITVPSNQFVVLGGNGVRIDNDVPNFANSYTVTAPNGYIGAAYAFSSGIGTVTSASDVRGVPPVQGVGGVTTTFYVGAAGATAFTTSPTSCDVTGLTAAAVGTDLPNSNATNANQAKVIVKDALGNQVCQNVNSSFAGGLFGVDKIAPNVTMTTNNNGAADVTGYNVSKNFSFIYNDTISGFNPATPLRGTLIRNFFTSQTAADCVIGTFSATAGTCSAAPITITSNTGTPPTAVGSIEFTGGTGVVGYYRVTANAVDQAGNPSAAAVTRIAAFDNVAPTVGGATQSPAAVAPLGTVTISATATDLFDLASSRGNLIYNPAGTAPTPVTFARVAGNSFGPNFDATLVTSGTATVALPNVYRGLQGTTAGNVIVGNAAAPTATITVTDVGTNSATSAPIAITQTAGNAPTNVQVGNSFIMTSSVAAAPATQQASTTMTIRVVGAVADPAFQSQPFAQVDVYRAGTAGELSVSGTSTLASVTDQGAVRTYTYQVSVPLVSSATAATVNTFYAVGRTTAGDAVIGQAVTITNP